MHGRRSNSPYADFHPFLFFLMLYAEPNIKE